MADKKEQGSVKPRTPRQTKQQAEQPKEQQQQSEQTLRVLVLRNCNSGGQEYKALRRYDLPRKAALQLIADGNAKAVR